jgi:hypothetical protein
MFALQHRGELPPVVEREFENFMSRLRKFLLATDGTTRSDRGQHNEDGTHTGITYTGSVTSITIVNGIVTDVTP